MHAIINWVPELKELTVSADHYKPIMRLTEPETDTYIDIVEHLKKSLIDTGNIFHNQIVKLEATKFILELSDSFMKKRSEKDMNIGMETRGEEIYRLFMSLVIQHSKEEHEVSFYASQLNMTAANLSRVIMKSSGKPPIKWISEALIAEAKIMLRNPAMNIQQVAHDLHFSDQSSFGKFFRKHTGITPLAYRSKQKQVEVF